MRERVGRLTRNAIRLTVVGVGSAVAATLMMSVGAITANAEVTEVAPRPNVTSRQALIIDQYALRRTAQGNVRGLADETRRAGRGGINAHGEVREGTKAVVGTRAAPFNLTRKGTFRTGAPIGSW